MNTSIQQAHLIVALVLLLTAFGCSLEEIPPLKPDTSGMSVAEFFESLPSWDEFADNAPVSDVAPTGEAATEISQTLDVDQIQEDGSIETIYNVSFTCQETPHSLTEDPSNIVMYNPTEALLWPGTLLQGISHKDPNRTLESLLIGQRDSITIAIPSLATSDNFRRVPASYASSQAAINDMISSAPSFDRNNFSYSTNTYHTEQQMALEMGLSGKYLGFRESASGDTSRNVAENTVAAHFFEKMYEVVIEHPATPEAFFTDDLSPEEVQEQVDRGHMGSDNLPIYVSNVVYGRMMMFTVTSTASEQAIKAMIHIAANSMQAGENVTTNMTEQQKAILATANIAVSSRGGQADATVSMIQTGNWNDFFELPVPLYVASPLAYTFRYLQDGSIARITETAKFDIKTCINKVEVPGIFDFLSPNTVGMSDISSPMEALTGDFNDDGREDILLNHKGNGQNQIKIGYGRMDGSFDFQAAVDIERTPTESWENYETHLADLNGDQLMDIVWNYRPSEVNKVYFALNRGNNQFDVDGYSEYPGSGWDQYVLHIGDSDNDGADELLWNVTGSHNRIYVGQLSFSENVIGLSAPTTFNSTWAAYDSYVGNVDGGGVDVIFNYTNSANGTYVGLSNEDDSFTLSSFSQRSQTGWHNFDTYIGQADNNSYADLIFNSLGEDNRVYVNRSNGDGTFDLSSGPQDHPETEDWSSYKAYIGDVNGDGIDDIVWTDRGSGSVYTAIGTNSGMYDFSPVKQDNPYQTTWSAFSVCLLDINGDNKKDLLWIRPGGSTEMHTALAK